MGKEAANSNENDPSLAPKGLSGTFKKIIDKVENYFEEDENSQLTEKQDQVKSLGASKKIKPKPKLKPKPKPWTKFDYRLLLLLCVISIIAFPFALVIFKALLSGLIASAIFYPLLLFIYIPIIYVAFRKKLRDKTANAFINLFKKLFKLPQKLYKESQSLVPKNNLTRLVLNIGFVVFWHRVCILIDYNYYFRSLELYWSSLYVFFIFTLFLAPIFFITFTFWYKDIKDIPNTFINAKKETKRRLKTTAKSLSKSNISDADELKKYAELRDQGIITEEEFQAKKKKLLDL